jgi:acetamidase/formamidase
MARTHEIPAGREHFFWDERHEPVLEVEDGDTVVLQTREITDEQLGPDSTAADVAALDADRFYPLTGPIRMSGAEPGDTLAVDVVGLETQDWGWTAIIPGLGLLADDFAEPYLRIFDIAGSDVAQLEEASVPLAPFLGTMGVCPAGARDQVVMPPGPFGGNLDTRQLVVGSTLYLPVHVEGAMFSTGDGHGVQGDGEVCVSALEATLGVELRFRLEKGRTIPGPQFRTPAPLTPQVDTAPYYGTTGVGPDLFVNAQNAIRAMIEHLGREHGLSPEDAYILCSLCVDLKISEIVDAGHWVVSALLPEMVFGRT